MVKPTIQKLPKPPIKPSEEQPKKKGRKKRPTITDIHEGQLYINGQWLAVDPPMRRPSRSEMRKEAWHDIWQDIKRYLLSSIPALVKSFSYVSFVPWLPDSSFSYLN